MRLVLGYVIATAGILALGAPMSTARAQGPCRIADDLTAATIDYVREMMAGQDSAMSATRQAYQLPVVADTAIAVVADSSVCAQAATAYNAALPAAARVADRRVYVIRVGLDRYVVWDRWTSDGLSGGYEATMVFDAAFTHLASFAT